MKPPEPVRYMDRIFCSAFEFAHRMRTLKEPVLPKGPSSGDGQISSSYARKLFSGAASIETTYQPANDPTNYQIVSLLLAVVS